MPRTRDHRDFMYESILRLLNTCRANIDAVNKASFECCDLYKRRSIAGTLKRYRSKADALNTRRSHAGALC